jgi:hypothetical protein
LHPLVLFADLPFCSVRGQAFNIGFDALLTFRHRIGYSQNLCVCEDDNMSVFPSQLAGAMLDSGKAVCVVLLVLGVRRELWSNVCNYVECPKVSVLYLFEAIDVSDNGFVRVFDSIVQALPP